MNAMTIDRPRIVSREEWLVARKAHLAKEKALTRARDELAAERRALPWVRIDKTYVFDGPNGPLTLADLFDGRSQLIVYHFMFAPGWKEGCTGCSFLADHFDGVNRHLTHAGATFVAISRAPFAEFQAFKARMGWHFPWVSSYGSDFNYDFGVSFTKEQIGSGKAIYNFGTSPETFEELHGTSVFFKDDAGDIFHTYSTYARGDEALLGTMAFLDLTPKGRNETTTMSWVRLHDRYEDDGRASVFAPAGERMAAAPAAASDEGRAAKGCCCG